MNTVSTPFARLNTRLNTSFGPGVSTVSTPSPVAQHLLLSGAGRLTINPRTLVIGGARGHVFERWLVSESALNRKNNVTVYGRMRCAARRLHRTRVLISFVIIFLFQMHSLNC